MLPKDSPLSLRDLLVHESSCFQPSTLLLHHCLLDGSVSVYSVGIRDEVFVPPLRCANSRTPAFLVLPLCSVKHFLRNMVHSLDHFSFVRPSFAGSVCHITVDLCLCTSSATGMRVELLALTPDGSQPLTHSCWLTSASAHSRVCFLSSLLAVLLCSTQ